MYRIVISSLLSIISVCSFSQVDIVGQEFKAKFDSLNYRIDELNAYITTNSENRDAKYFSSKRELDMTIFVRAFEEYIYNENLVEANNLIESKIKISEKRYDNWAVKYYKGYSSKLTNIRANKQRHYQTLFEKEKTFKKEYDKYTEVNTSSSLTRAKRMVELAIQYAESQGRQETLKYLYKYKWHTEALLYDLDNPYNLAELTSANNKFHALFDELIESDSLSDIQKAGELAEFCLYYSKSTSTKIDSAYFIKQKTAVANAIADWNDRQGISSELTSLTGAAIVSRFDSLNKLGVYKWNNYIVVIGNLKFSSKSEMVRRGEIILNADKVLFNYIRVNRLDKLKSNKIKSSGTFILPYNDNGKARYYTFDPFKVTFQYMVCYTNVINNRVTGEISRFLPPMQFQEEIDMDKEQMVNADL